MSDPLTVTSYCRSIWEWAFPPKKIEAVTGEIFEGPAFAGMFFPETLPPHRGAYRQFNRRVLTDYENKLEERLKSVTSSKELREIANALFLDAHRYNLLVKAVHDTILPCIDVSAHTSLLHLANTWEQLETLTAITDHIPFEELSKLRKASTFADSENIQKRMRACFSDWVRVLLTHCQFGAFPLTAQQPLLQMLEDLNQIALKINPPKENFNFDDEHIAKAAREIPDGVFTTAEDYIISIKEQTNKLIALFMIAGLLECEANITSLLKRSYGIS